MRIKILRPAAGVMESVSLVHLLPGLTYEVSPSLGMWLVSRGVAEEVAAGSIALVVPLDNPRAFEQLTRGVSIVQPLAVAADTPPRKRKRQRKH